MSFFFLSLFFICGSVLMTSILDMHMQDQEKPSVSLTAARRQRLATSDIEDLGQSRATWQLCILNFSFLRMADEARSAFKEWRKGRVPAAAFDQVRSIEGLLEALPQSLILAYSLVKNYSNADLDFTTVRYVVFGAEIHSDVIKLSSCVGSMVVASVSLANLGQGVRPLWRICFFLFCFFQLVLRVFTFMSIVLLVREHCEGPFELSQAEEKLFQTQNFSRLWTQPEHCGYNSESGIPHWVVVGTYALLSFFIGAVFHVVHLQGLSGGSLTACMQQRDGDGGKIDEQTNSCCKLLRSIRSLTILNPKAIYTWIIAILNMFIAFDCSPFSVLKNAEPRPPRLLFFIFRMAEIVFSLKWFEDNQRKPTPTGQKYLFDFDAFAIAL
jgi:hypothetical protein